VRNSQFHETTLRSETQILDLPKFDLRFATKVDLWQLASHRQ